MEPTPSSSAPRVSAPRPLVPPMTRSLATIMAHGQSLERHGQRGDARRIYEEALASGDIIEPSGLAQLHRWIARTHMQDSDYPAAEAAARTALALSERANDESGRGHAINMLAVICFQQGLLDDAERLYLDARASAQESGDARLAAMTATNLGNVAAIRGDHAEALRCHESALNDARGG